MANLRRSLKRAQKHTDRSAIGKAKLAAAISTVFDDNSELFQHMPLLSAKDKAMRLAKRSELLDGLFARFQKTMKFPKALIEAQQHILTLDVIEASSTATEDTTNG